MKYMLFVLLIFGTALLNGQTWNNDLNKASVQAQKENKEILLVFQGSDWCAPCMKLEREIWTSSDFREYAEDHLILVKADFPRRAKNQLEPAQQEKNNMLAEKYNKEGHFPLVILLDKNGIILGKTGYKKVSPKDYIELLNSFKADFEKAASF